MEPSPTLPPEPATPQADVSADAGAGAAAKKPLVERLSARFTALPPARRAAVAGGAVLACLLVLAWTGTGYVYRPIENRPPALTGQVPETDAALKAAVGRARTRERQLAARVKAAAPRGVFIVVDQTHNRLYLKKDDDVLLEAVCSAGSGMVLRESGGKKREWVFDTPRGRFEVLSRAERPVWRKPDWAFVEEGQPIPKNPADRLEYGTLGEYALYFGNGYMIHGTLYERLLGRAVSHGCIRVGRDDLRKVWASAKLGTPIFIY